MSIRTSAPSPRRRCEGGSDEVFGVIAMAKEANAIFQAQEREERERRAWSMGDKALPTATYKIPYLTPGDDQKKAFREFQNQKAQEGNPVPRTAPVIDPRRKAGRDADGIRRYFFPPHPRAQPQKNEDPENPDPLVRKVTNEPDADGTYLLEALTYLDCGHDGACSGGRVMDYDTFVPEGKTWSSTWDGADGIRDAKAPDGFAAKDCSTDGYFMTKEMFATDAEHEEALRQRRIIDPSVELDYRTNIYKSDFEIEDVAFASAIKYVPDTKPPEPLVDANGKEVTTPLARHAPNDPTAPKDGETYKGTRKEAPKGDKTYWRDNASGDASQWKTDLVNDAVPRQETFVFQSLWKRLGEIDPTGTWKAANLDAFDYNDSAMEVPDVEEALKSLARRVLVPKGVAPREIEDYVDGLCVSRGIHGGDRRRSALGNKGTRSNRSGMYDDPASTVQRVHPRGAIDRKLTDKLAIFKSADGKTMPEDPRSLINFKAFGPELVEWSHWVSFDTSGPKPRGTSFVRYVDWKDSYERYPKLPIFRPDACTDIHLWEEYMERLRDAKLLHDPNLYPEVADDNEWDTDRFLLTMWAEGETDARTGRWKSRWACCMPPGWEPVNWYRGGDDPVLEVRENDKGLDDRARKAAMDQVLPPRTTWREDGAPGPTDYLYLVLICAGHEAGGFGRPQLEAVTRLAEKLGVRRVVLSALPDVVSFYYYEAKYVPTSRSGRSLGWIAQRPVGDAFAFLQGKKFALDVYNARLLKKADFVDPALGRTPIPFYAELDQARYGALVVPTLVNAAGILPRDQTARNALLTEATNPLTLNRWMPDVAQARRNAQNAQREKEFTTYMQPGGENRLVTPLPPPRERVPHLNPGAPRVIIDNPDPDPGMGVSGGRRTRRRGEQPSLSTCDKNNTRTPNQRGRSGVRCKSQGAPSSVRRSTRPRKPNREFEE